MINSLHNCVLTNTINKYKITFKAAVAQRLIVKMKTIGGSIPARK